MGIHTLTVNSPFGLVFCGDLQLPDVPDFPIPSQQTSLWDVIFFRDPLQLQPISEGFVWKHVIFFWAEKHNWTMLYYAKPNAIAVIQDQHLDLQEFSRFIKTFLKAAGGWISVCHDGLGTMGTFDTLGGIPHDSTPKNSKKDLWKSKRSFLS